MPRDSAGVVAPPPLVYAAGIGLGFALDALLPSADLPGAARIGVGVPLLAAGATLMGAFVRELARSKTAINPAHATTTLVTSGPYRLTRNPGYLGMSLVGAGIGMVTGAVWVLAGVALAVAVVDRGVIAREERYLESKFGGAYAAYRARVRRWV